MYVLLRDIRSKLDMGFVDMSRLFFLSCFLSITFAAPIWATEFDGKWILNGELKEERAGRWTCSETFGLRFAIDGDTIKGDMKGHVDSRGRITAKEGDRTPSTFTGAISGSKAQGTWRIRGDGCTGTWEAWRLYPLQTEFPEKIPGATVRMVQFTKSLKESDLTDNLSEVSIESEHVNILVWWDFDLEEIERFKVQYEVFDGKGNRIAGKADYPKPKSSVWRTFLPVTIRKDRHEPGDWKFVVYFNDRKAVQTILTVKPD